MSKIIGKYQHVKNENTDEYFAAVGVPYLIRKMMAVSSPSLEIYQNGNNWSIKNSSLLRTSEQTFILGEEYEEQMPNGEILKSITTLEDENTLVTNSIIVKSGIKTSRSFVFTDDSCVITLQHEKSQVIAKRYFSKI